MTNKRALQILVSAAQEKNQVYDGVVYTSEELAQAMYRVNKMRKHLSPS